MKLQLNFVIYLWKLVQSYKYPMILERLYSRIYFHGGICFHFSQINITNKKNNFCELEEEVNKMSDLYSNVLYHRDLLQPYI